MTASFSEIVQTAAAGIGAVLTVRAMINADLNLIAVVRSGFNGNRKMIARKNVRVERCVLAVQVGLFLAGLTTCFIPAFVLHSDLAEMHPDLQELLRTARQGSSIRLFVMTAGSLILMYLSYRNWLEERIPNLASRRSEAGTVTPSVVVTTAQDAASKAQVSATVAQDAASVAQNTAILAQDEATGKREVADSERRHGHETYD